MNSQINDFVYEALRRGVSREDISAGLLKGGWTSKEINAALDAFVECDLPLPVPRKRVSGSAKEAFLFLVLFSSLYTFVFGLGSVLFDLINIHLPAPGETVWRWVVSLRYGIASVIVSFPVFLFMVRLITREAQRNPGQRISPVRRWLTYLTLFVASVSIVADLISLIVRFLSGDLTLRFGLKVLVVGVLAGIVFIHYLRDLRQDEVAPSAEHRLKKSGRIAYAVMIAAVLGILGFGFWTAGSPMKARLYAQDNQRISDLANICRRVQLFYKNQGVLPRTLSDCDINPGTYINQKTDRVTGDSYLYRVIDATHFEVGAVFDLPTSEDGPKTAAGYIPGTAMEEAGFWDHDAGRKTFKVDATRINPDRN
ncbi:MAG: hypothetical protein JXR49_04680 [Acidobacteria bacterium]|nr:hypothetical protein [Acidobacteriota bacterium]